MIYTASDIASLLGLPQPPFPQAKITTLLTDSRSVDAPAHSMFFALLTTSGDGHHYMAELYRKGVRNFVVKHCPVDMDLFPEANFFIVDDTLEALQALARAHRNRFHDLPVIGVTGSRGKTIVKEWLYQLLQPSYEIVRSPRSYNSQIGVPLSVWEINEESTLGIFEAGVSKMGEMTTLQSIIQPTIGIITNIGLEHQEGFPSKEAKCREKVTLLRGCDTVIYCADSRIISKAVADACLGANELAWSRRDPERPLYIKGVFPKLHSTVIEYYYLQQPGRIEIPFTESADAENAIHCLAAMLLLGVHPDEIAKRMASLSPVATRLNVIEAVNNCLVIHDGYTADFGSLRPALDFMARRATAGRDNTVILSDLMHESLPSDQLYRATAHLLRTRGISKVIGVGEEISRHSRYFDPEARFFSTTEEMLREMSPSDFVDELILIKGAAPFHFEQVSEILEAKHHETVLEVNLDSLIHNFNFYRSRLRPTTGIVAMVKASAYGAGALEVSKSLQSQGAAYLAVAVVDEGVELRRAGVTMPIMVLNPKVVNYRALFGNQLEPEIFSIDMLRDIIREGEKLGITNFPIHIKLDTGMHRLGFNPEDIPQVVNILQSQDVVTPRSIFSHLACADDPKDDAYTLQQLEIFHSTAELLQSAFPHKILKHILNSTGITRFPEHQCDMVRLGICLYGIPTMDDHSQDDLRPVSTLRTVIISIKEWPAGTTIGYNRRGKLERHSRIATIPVGYADGVNRHLGCGHASFIVNGHRCPTVGNICMDACMIDVTDVPCAVGDAVEIFGTQMPATVLAHALDTIPYEILTAVSPRVKRVYYRE